MPQQDSRDRASVIRAKLAAGTLPTTRPSQVWASESRGGEDCDGCDQMIRAGEIEHEVNMAEQGVFRFHRSCFDVWQQQRAAHLDESPVPAPGIAEALWQFLESHRQEMFCAACLAMALKATSRLDRALFVAEGRGARRRHGKCSICGKQRLLCGLASN